MSLPLKQRLAIVPLLLAAHLNPPATLGQALTFTTLAGPQGGPGFDDGTGSAARFNSTSGVATDTSGNVYVADSSNHTIRKITPAGAVTTLAGLAGSFGTADGTGSAARFRLPSGVAIDSSGNAYVADSGNETIRKITPAGAVTTLAGLAGTGGIANGTGSAARFNRPTGVATDSSGNVYVADINNHAIRKITPAGVVTTLAGLAGTSGSADGTGSAARFNRPEEVATDSGGNVYVADGSNHTIRKITPAGVVTTLAGLAGVVGTADGTGSAARFQSPSGVATDNSGNVYVAEFFNYAIRKITSAGAVTTLAGLAGISGSSDGIGSAARFFLPKGVATDSSGNVYVADRGNHTIRKITPAGAVTTLAGFAITSGSADGSGNAARFRSPYGVATDSSGNVYVADNSNSTIRKITPAGAVTTLAGLAGSFGSADGTGSAARFSFPQGVATDSGNVYVADTGNNTIRKISPAGAVTTLAGLAGVQGSADGTGSAARFSSPTGVATDSSGNVHVADEQNHTIRKVTPAGAVTTLAGLAGSLGGADGTGSAARFNLPFGVATDTSGNVYVADRVNRTIRKITPAGTVTTLAGLAGAFGSDDGTGSAARFSFTRGVATDGSGNVYVADESNRTIRKISPAGAVTTLAGRAETSGTADGTGSAARFNLPSGAATDSSGNVFVADVNNHTIRIGRAALADVATIDLSAGPPGATRQLDTSPQSAVSWQWSVIRRPVDSVALLSSATVRNPTFIPDVPGLFMFRVIATGTSNASITTVDLQAGMAPTITASGNLSRVQGTASSGTIATVTDVEDSPATLTVTATSVPAGITVTGITNANGTITATVAASCGASVGANTVSLMVADSGGQTSNASVTVNVTANPAPVLGTYPSSTVSSGGSTTVSPSVAPNDDGSIASATATATGFTGSLTVNPTSGAVSISSAGPVGNYTVMVAAADNCGLAGSTSFALTVAAARVAGDVNGDGRVSVADVFYLINFLFTGGPAPIGPGDVNADVRVSVADVFYLINFLFVGGPAPLG